MSASLPSAVPDSGATKRLADPATKAWVTEMIAGGDLEGYRSQVQGATPPAISTRSAAGFTTASIWTLLRAKFTAALDAVLPPSASKSCSPHRRPRR